MATDVYQRTDTPATEKPTNDDIFMQAVQEHSNLEMDWLWLATKVSSIAQCRYALERALQINPRSALAKRGLAQIRRRPIRRQIGNGSAGHESASEAEHVAEPPLVVVQWRDHTGSTVPCEDPRRPGDYISPPPCSDLPEPRTAHDEQHPHHVDQAGAMSGRSHVRNTPMVYAAEDRARCDAHSKDLQPHGRNSENLAPLPALTAVRGEIAVGKGANEPKHPELYHRLKNSFGPTYLTVLSVIQGVALSNLAAVVTDRYAHFTLVNWLLVLMTFCVLVVTSYVYTLQSVMWDWIPDLRDWAIPFVVGALELFLARTLATSLAAWLLGLAAFAFLGALATEYIGWRAEDDPDNADLLEILTAHHQRFAGFLAADGALLLVLGLISHVTGADAVRWGHDVRSLLVLCIVIITAASFGGALYLAHTYLRKAVAYAHHGDLPHPRHMRARRRSRSADHKRPWPNS